ncbi:MAG: peptidylprolyl isomerase [Bacteroidales bacterium]|nr:peptidylprolyl isomerase [Bacteroidales bacterium]
MSALEKIRKHPGLVITVLSIALLIFIYQIVAESKNRNGRSSDDETVVYVDNERILISDFDNLRNKNVEQTRRSNGGEISQAQTYGIYNNTLEKMIKDCIMNKEYEAVGMNVTSEEMLDLFVGNEPHEWVAQNFSNNGVFEKDRVEYILQNFDELCNMGYVDREMWIEFENQVKENRLETKFNNLVKASYFVPTKLAEKYYNNKNEKTSAEVVALRYSNIADTDVEITDQDIKKFYQENKYKYETPATRSIEYVVFDVKPSQEDKDNAFKVVSELKDNFAATENVINFVNANSETDHRYDSTWKGRKDVPVEIEQVIFDEGNQPGFVYGPYFDNEAYNLVRIVEFQDRADSLRASHILIPYAGALSSADTVTTKEMAQKRADSIASALKKNPKDTKLFGKLAGKYSSDKGSAEKEGDLDWFPDGMMVPTFNEFVMKNNVGQIGVVESPFGYHVIKVTGKTEMQPKARLAIVTQKVNTSSDTYKKMYSYVNKFVTENRTQEQFNAAVEAEGLTKRVQPSLTVSTNQIPGINNPRSIVRWAFDKKTKVGNVSNMFELDDMFVVAVLTEAIEEGYAPVEKIAEQYKPQILNLKKGEVAVGKMQACGNDYDRMVNELKAESTTVSDLTMDSRSVGNFGVEANIIGTILGMKEGEVVGPVAGNISAFVIKNVKHQAAPATTDYSAILREKKAQFDNKVFNGGVYNALHEKADIEDNRVKFY